MSRTRTGQLSGQRGSGSLWAVVVVAVLLTVTAGALSWSAAVVARQQAESVADMAALSGARAHAVGEDGCVAAARVAAAGGARLADCHVDGTAVTVLVERSVRSRLLQRLDMAPARARARAGASP